MIPLVSEHISLQAAAKEPSLLVGKRCNVRFSPRDFDAVPLIRTVTSVQIKNKKGVNWLHWTWTPEPRPEGMDCGYSGISDQHDHYLDATLEVTVG